MPELEEQLDADAAITQLFTAHYAGLVRLAALLLKATSAADEVVQDAFVALHARWDTIRDETRALGYLRRTVVNACNSRHRHLAVVDKYLPRMVLDEPSAEHQAIRHDTAAAVAEAIAALPEQQRTVMVLRYYSELSEAEIAETMGISRGSVKSHASRAAATLRERLGSVL